MAGETTTREERLAWTPEQAIERVRASGGSESATAALALSEQLDAAGVPLESLEACVVFWSRALDGLDPGPVPAGRLDRLDRDLALESATSPVLDRWMSALRRSVAVAHDLDRIIQLLMQARSTWTSIRWMKARAQPARHEFPIGAQLEAGTYIIVDHVRGEPARGMYRAVNRHLGGDQRYLVTMGTPQRRAPGERTRELAFAVEGVAPLRYIGPVAGHASDYHAMVEDEPVGRPSSTLALPLTPAAAIELVTDVAHVLERLHATGSVVRHLRPQLIYVEHRGTAPRLSGLVPRAEQFLSDVTSPCYGVPPLFEDVFYAPEVLALAPTVTPAADVFSLCAILGLWLTGEHPFSGHTPMDQLASIYQGRGRSWRGPKELGEVLGAGLEPDPRQRPPLDRLVRDVAAAARAA